jgi:hypothetical protein
MDSPYLQQQTRLERIYIHRYRIYLQVATLSDIATAAGTQIHNLWYKVRAERPSKSTLIWPRQNPPNKTAWNAWVRFLRSFTNQTGRLKKSLG